MKKFFKDFKAFISRGNILDMAIGVIIGGAFSAIVSAFTDKIIMPIVNYALSFGGENGLESAYTFLKKVPSVEDPNIADLTKSIYIDWGAFITAILNFLIIALTLFIILKVAMKSSEILSKSKEALNKNTLSKEDKAELKKRGIKLSDKEAVNAYIAERDRLAEEKKQQEEAEAKAKAEQERLENPTQEDLLKQILEVMKQNQENKG